MSFDYAPSPQQILNFVILGFRVRIACPDAALRQLFLAKFGAMVSAERPQPPDLDYSVENDDNSLSIARPGQVRLQAACAGDLLFLLEKDLTVELQRKRSDHLFLHSAALVWRGRACLLAADSGSGKSLTAWALLHHGFDYLSDELSPIDLESLRVAPYPQALCLKQPPPPSYPLPEAAIHLDRTIHIPTDLLPGATATEPYPLGGVFLLSYRPALPAPELHAIGPAEAAARMYLTALNALSHPHRGLDAVLKIAGHVPCFSVAATELASTCRLIRAAAEDACALGLTNTEVAPDFPTAG